MITDDYCSFEIAKLLKEKGFPQYKKEDGFRGLKYNIDGELTCAPYAEHYRVVTQSIALKWLREVHKIVLDIVFEANKGWTFYVSHLITETLSDGSTYVVDIQHCVWSDDVQQPYYKEYEQAVEAAILYALKNLI